MAKKKSKKASVKRVPSSPAIQQADKGIVPPTPEIRQHHEIEQVGKYSRNITQTPLDRYYQRGFISKPQYEAGMKLWELAERASLINLRTQTYDPTSGCSGSSTNQTEHYVISPMQHVAKIRDAMLSLSQESQRIITQVVIDGHFVFRLSSKRGERDSMMLQLRKGLDELAHHWSYGHRTSPITRQPTTY